MLGQTISRHTSILALYFTQQVSWTIPNLSLDMTIKNQKLVNLTKSFSVKAVSKPNMYSESG